MTALGTSIRGRLRGHAPRLGVDPDDSRASCGDPARRRSRIQRICAAFMRSKSEGHESGTTPRIEPVNRRLTLYTLSRMALKVVPAGDERCDIHNGPTPASYICEECGGELRVETGAGPAVGGKPIRRLRSTLRRAGRRARRRLRPAGWRVLLLGAVAIVVIAGTILLITA